MGILISILLPVAITGIVSVWTYQELKTFLVDKREEYKLISVAISFMIGLFAGIGTLAFL